MDNEWITRPDKDQLILKEKNDNWTHQSFEIKENYLINDSRKTQTIFCDINLRKSTQANYRLNKIEVDYEKTDASLNEAEDERVNVDKAEKENNLQKEP